MISKNLLKREFVVQKILIMKLDAAIIENLCTLNVAQSVMKKDSCSLKS